LPEDRSPRERFQAEVDDSGGLGAWTEAVDWSHGEREMEDFYSPLSGQNRLYVEWVYGRISSLFNAVMAAAAESIRDTHQESAIEMLCGRTITDLQCIGFLNGKGYYSQAYSAARMTYECCDLVDLFWADPSAAADWFETTEAHRDFSRRRVRERLLTVGYAPQDDNDIYGMLCERSHPRWAGIVHTLIEPHKVTLSPISGIPAGAFHWDAGFWTMAAIWRMGFRLRYIQAGMPPNPNVAAMLTSLNATFYITLAFQRRRVGDLISDEQRDRFSRWHDRLERFIQSDGEAMARRVETIQPR
jgi:hypothetical protein